MKRKFVVFSFIIFSAVSLLLLLVWSPSFTSHTISETESVDKFIKVDRLSNKVIVVKMGYDAITAFAAENGIVVIDAGISNSLTAKFRKVIEKEFNRDDFTYLINTHSHSDHTGGNQVFAEAVIVGHENCPNEIAESTKEPEKIKTNLLKIVDEYDKKLKAAENDSGEHEEILCQKLRYQFTYNDWVNDRIVTYPEVTFGDTMSIYLGDVTFDLIYFGKAHTGSDILVHIPEAKILMTGDLFFSGGRPSIGNVTKHDVERWKTVKQWITKRWDKIENIIGGHGQIMTKNDLVSFNEYIDEKWEELK